MNAAVMQARNALSSLKDPTLFKEKNFIDGQWVDADGKGTINVDNPADSSVVGTVPNCGAEETKRAIEAARKAQHGWAKRAARSSTGPPSSSGLPRRPSGSMAT